MLTDLLLLQENKVDEASKVIDNFLKNSPSDPNAQILRGQILVRQGKASDAVHILEQAVKSAPDNAAAHYQLGSPMPRRKMRAKRKRNGARLRNCSRTWSSLCVH